MHHRIIYNKNLFFIGNMKNHIATLSIPVMNDTNKILSMLNGLIIIICSMIYLYHYTLQLKQKTVSRRIIIIITAIILSGALTIEAKSVLTIHLSYETSLLGAFLFWTTLLALLLKAEIWQVLEKYKNILRRIFILLYILLFGLGCWVVYLELSS